MPDDRTPSTEEPEALTDDEAERLGDARLNEILAQGGRKRIEHRCSACATKDVLWIDIADVDAMVKIQQYRLAKAKARAAQESSEGARILDRRVEEMSDVELMEAYRELA